MADDARLETFRGWRREGIDAQIDVLLAHPDATVPAYPRWTMRDLGVHVVRVYGMAIGALTSDTLDRPADELPVSADDDVATIAASVRDALKSAEAGFDSCTHERIWTPAGPRPPLFWQRRLLREAILHRWDAEQAVGDPGVPADDPSLELVDECLDTDISRAFADDDTRTGAVTIRAADRCWTVDMTARTVTPDARAATTISGEPAVVWLWLMGREDLPGTVTSEHDDGSLGRFSELVGGLKRPSPKN